MSIKIVIADDDVLIRDGLRVIFDLDERFDVIESVENGAEAYRICKKNKVDLALLDVRMPVMNGVEATLKIVSETESKVLILTTFDEDEFIKTAFDNGASGYLLKNNSADKIKNAVISVLDGNMVVQDIVMNQITSKKNHVRDQET